MREEAVRLGIMLGHIDETAFSGVVASIYDAASSPELWPDALGRLGHVFGANCVSLIERNQYTFESRGTAWGVDAGAQRDYFAFWGAQNPLVRRKRTWRAGEIDTDRQVIPKNDLVSTDYYHGFMKPHDMHAVMRLTLDAGTGPNGQYHRVLNLSRPSSGGDFEAEDVETARHFLSHFQRAVRIGRQLENAQAMLDGVTDMLERSPAGVLLLDGAGRIVFANRAAQAMAGTQESFVLRRDRIEALDSRDAAALRTMIGRAISRDVPADAARGGALRLGRKSGRQAFNAVAAPLARRDWRVDTGPVAFVLITDPDKAAASEDILAQLFGFSPAESRVAERLIAGDTPEQAAAALDIRISTARWHLASLYRKTGTGRQAELVRLLLSLPALHTH